MKAVHFGAGNIGRGFIGILLSQSGFEVTFVARNEKKVHALQQQKKYYVTLANENKDIKLVNNISAINSKNEEAVTNSIVEADLVTTAVGLASLKHIAESIAKGIVRRLELGVKAPLHIIACENALDGSSQLKQRIFEYLPESMQAESEEYVAFPNTAVDRIVPVQETEDPLKVTVEPYFEWVIDRSAMLEGFPEIKGVKYVDALEPYIERKLFTVNTGHAVAAYHGYLAGYDTIQEAMLDEKLKLKVKNVMRETGRLLTTKYHWNEEKHMRYIEKMLNRFSNPRLTDEIIRVGRSPLRKLSLNDRLVRPALQAHRLGLDITHLVDVIAAALLYDYENDPEAVSMQTAIAKRGIDEVLTAFMGIPQKHAIHQQIAYRYHELKSRLGLKEVVNG
ncbi:mannitol-1-phosphate 5-dehydrogenase [Paenibacillus sp. HB172176]|uniref:mannitol-1-phosphate 5-dehydrogenase n=1 Tax=Paenibacillus sp. HB172176 TaxID=2493690 RepID=UPI001438C2C6|nr:mannitol-1-phosphate 5-dehydrogenase [Paenibacillus sp. HB172176]